MDGIAISNITTAATEHSQKIEKLQASHDVRRLDKYEGQAKNAREDRQIESQEEAVAMDTLQYAYNSTTDDLVIKIIRADGTVGQYPTESMMKLKELLKEDFIGNNN